MLPGLNIASALMKRCLVPLLCIGVAVAAFGADSAQSFSAQGQLLLQPFVSAPFPHAERAEGHKYKEEFFSAAEHYRDSTVAIFIPKGFRETGKIDFVVHFHGWRNHVEEVLRRYELIQQLVESGRNAVLVVPQGPRDAPDSFGGKLEDARGFKRFIDEVAEILRQRSALQKKDFALGSVILSGHSGGYRVMAAILDRGGMSDHVKEVWLFDALYAGTDKFLAWFEQYRGRLLDIYTEHGGTKAETEGLMATLKQRGTTFFTGDEAQATVSELSTNRPIFLFTDLEHDQVLSKRHTFKQFLETSCLKKLSP
jgi:hypothetical protein